MYFWPNKKFQHSRVWLCFVPEHSPILQEDFTNSRKNLKTQAKNSKLKQKTQNSSKKLEKSAFFETVFAGNASKKEACIKRCLVS